MHLYMCVCVRERGEDRNRKVEKQRGGILDDRAVEKHTHADIEGERNKGRERERGSEKERDKDIRRQRERGGGG